MRFLSAAGNNKDSGDTDTGRSRVEQQGIYPPPNNHGSPRGPPLKGVADEKASLLKFHASYCLNL